MPQVAALTVLGHGLVCDRASQASISRRGRFLVESARGAPRGSGGQLGPPSTSAPPAPGPSSPTRPGNCVNPTDTDASPTGGSANRPGDPPGSPRLPTKPGPTPPHSARVSHEVTGPGRSSRPVTYEGQCADVWSGTRPGCSRIQRGSKVRPIGTPLSRLSARLRHRPQLGRQLGGRRHGGHRARKLPTPRPTARCSSRRWSEPP